MDKQKQKAVRKAVGQEGAFVDMLNQEMKELQDSQKQIEEMAKELCPHYDNGNCYYEVTEVCECCFGCEFCWAVSQVLNAGYRKIPEGAVVLTREEYEKLKGEER